MTNIIIAAVIKIKNNKQETKPVFCTLFNIDNEHLTKDVGLIPYGMHEFYRYDSFMATYINGEYPNLKYVPGLRIEEVPKISGNYIIDSCKWLAKNAKRIDVLNIYHMILRSFLVAVIYKIFNPSGKIYLKFDGGIAKNIVKFYKRPFSFCLLRLCKLRSIEFEQDAKLLSQDWNREIIYVPNPFNPNEIRDFRPFNERSNIILFTGRIEEAKGSHTLLEAFARINEKIPEYKLKLVGKVTEENIMNDFYRKYPHLKERVIFTGNISDREEITEIYRDAKIFAFPSRHEGCPLSLSEALMHGNFAVTSDIRPNELMTENFRFARSSKVDDVEGLAENLLYACTHEDESERLALEGRESTMKRCNLKHISEIISEGLK